MAIRLTGDFAGTVGRYRAGRHHFVHPSWKFTDSRPAGRCKNKFLNAMLRARIQEIYGAPDIYIKIR